MVILTYYLTMLIFFVGFGSDFCFMNIIKMTFT